MPWTDQTIVTSRREFVTRATQEGANMTALCRQYGISRKTGYKWRRIAATEEGAALVDQRRTPHHQPRRCAPETEAAVVAMRARYPTWGGRKLEVKLAETGLTGVPRPSPITVILQRHGLIPPRQERPPPATRRFEHATPHDLWPMDFMGHRAMQAGRVHPLTIRDDQSRVLLSLTACPHEQLETVWTHLEACFVRYGLPRPTTVRPGAPAAATASPGSTPGCCGWGSNSGMAGSATRRPKARSSGSMARSASRPSGPGPSGTWPPPKPPAMPFG